MSFFTELKRRNIFRVVTLYLVAGWLVLQVADVLSGVMGLPDWTLRLIALILGLGFLFVVIFAFTAVEDIISAVSLQYVITCPTFNTVIARATKYKVVSLTAEDHIITNATISYIVIGTAVESIHALATD